MLTITNNSASNGLKINFRAPGKLYNMRTGTDATAASPYPFDTANVAAGESVSFEGNVVSMYEVPDALVTGIESHDSPDTYAKNNQNGPAE